MTKTIANTDLYNVIVDVGYGECYIAANPEKVGWNAQYLRKDGTTNSSLRGKADWFSTVKEADTFLSEWKVKQAHLGLKQCRDMYDHCDKVLAALDRIEELLKASHPNTFNRAARVLK